MPATAIARRGFDPKDSQVTVEYQAKKADNLIWYTLGAPYVPAYPGLQTTAELSPKGVVKYEDGTSPTAP